MIEAYFRRLWPRLAKAFDCWRRDKCGLLAAALAYYVSLAFFPLILILLAGTGLLMQSTDWGGDTQQRMFHAIEENTSEVLAKQVKDVLSEIDSRAIVSGPVGIVTLVLASIAVFLHLETAFGRVWKDKPAERRGILGSIRHVVIHRLKAFLMLLLVGALLVVSFMAGIALSAIAEWAGGDWVLADLAWKIGQFAVLLCVNVFLFAVIYKVHSSVTIKWSTALRGGLLSSVIWEIGRHLLAAFVIDDRYSAYGVVGSFLAIMLWLYCASAVLFLGLEYVCVLHHETRRE